MKKEETNNHEEWKRGILAGYRSVQPDQIPSIPPFPATVPDWVKDTNQYYYKLGHEKGVKIARENSPIN